MRKLKCPGCGQAVELDPAAETARCSACGKSFRLKKSSTPDADKPDNQDRTGTSRGDSSPAIEGGSRPVSVDDLLPPPVARPPTETATNLGHTLDTSHAAHAEGDPAQGITQAGEEFAISTDESRTGRTANSGRKIGFAVMVSILAIAVVAIVIGWLVSSWTIDEVGGGASHGDRLQGVSSANGQSTFGSDKKWIDAATKSARVAGVRVKIERLGYIPVHGRDDRQRVQSSGDTQFLHVFLKVSNESPKPVNYRSWYGNTFAGEGGQEVARLIDDQNREYSMMVFGDVNSVLGHTATATLGVRDSVNDVIIFEPPAGFQLEQVESWRLSLPLAAMDLADRLHFQVPRSMIPVTSDFVSPLSDPNPPADPAESVNN